MKQIYILTVVIIFTNCHATKSPQSAENNSNTIRDTTVNQKSLGLLSDSIHVAWPVIGTATNQKGGAVVLSQNKTYWIDGLYSWPDKFLNQQVKIWGDLELRYDAPVFIDTSTTVSQGIPVVSESDMLRQSQRFWIVNAKYELLKP